MTGGSLAEALGQSVLAGGAGTTLGALPVLLVRRIAPGPEAVLAGFSAGVMLAASFVALLLPALELAPSATRVLLGTAAGAAAIALLHRMLPHEHFGHAHAGPARSGLGRVWLLAIALALHNVPEGLAVGVAAASGDARVSWPVTWAIAAQNLPEGLIVAVAFLAAGQSRAVALLVTAATGLVEPLGALAGFTALQLTSSLLPAALAFAAGAMLFVVSHEIIPESHRAGRSTPATLGLVGGVLLMLQLDAWLG
jgi:zinc transporter, ZIP family